MADRVKAWLTDSLAKRLFLLMWGALVVSHVAAFSVVHLLQAWPWETPSPPELRLPTFPSLPPTPGLPDTPQGLPGPGVGPPHGAPPESAPPPAREARGPGLPTPMLLTDYGVRLALIALAAMWGASWVARPMRRLADASRTLGESLTRGTPLPLLNEHDGTSEVKETARVFNTVTRQLQAQFESRGLMIAAISHDLRTPLTRMRMRLETAEADSPHWRERCARDIRDMDELIRSVLEVFRNDPRPLSERLVPTDVAALAQSLADDLAEQGHAITVHAEAATVAWADPPSLKRVIGNLVGNALRYAGHTEVHVQATGDDVHLRVEDRGPGIPQAQLSAVFRPFYRVEGSRSRHTGGAGLGLYIAHDLTERQNGQLHLSNREGGGLCAKLTLRRWGSDAS